MTFLVVGASSGLGRELARALAAAGYDLVLVSSDGRDIEAVASDLAARYGQHIVGLAADLGGEDEGYLDRIDAALTELGTAAGLLFPVGATLEDDDGSLDIEAVRWITRTNYLAVVALVSRLRRRLAPTGGVVIGFGSVAALRGRRKNVAYAAAKRALQSYFESLRHTSAGGTVRIQFYVLGYLATNQVFGATPLPKGDPRLLARQVVRDLGRDLGTVYYPGWRRLIAVIVRLVPWTIYRRLKF